MVPPVMPKPTLVICLIVLAQSVLAGFLAVLTPYLYAILPITNGYLAPRSKPQRERMHNLLLYALSLIIIFTVFGGVLSAIVATTHFNRITGHWIFNFILFRIFAGLGISFIGAFELKLPASWANPTASRARSGDFRGIFYMALTLPIVSFSSTIPMVVLVLLLSAKAGVAGPPIGLFGFAAGLALPVVFPALLQVFVSSKDLLNKIKVLFGFSSILLSLKFFSKAEISLGWHIVDRDMFILLSMALSFMVGLYMLGILKLRNDHVPRHNIYDQEYTTILGLFIAIAAFTVVIYLLPGIWGAPLPAVARFLPPIAGN